MFIKRINIKSKILFSMLAIGFIPGIVGIASTYLKGMDVFRQSTGKELVYLTQQIAANVRTAINKEASKGVLITQHPGIARLADDAGAPQAALKQSIRNDLGKGVEDNPFATYLIYNRAGDLVLRLGAEMTLPVEPRLALSNFNQMGAAAMIGDPISSHSHDGFYIPVFTPIHRHDKGDDEAVTGGMLTYLNIPKLLGSIQIEHPAEVGHFNLLTESGMLIYDPFVTAGGIRFPAQIFQSLASGEQQWSIGIDEHGIESLYTLVPLLLGQQAGIDYGGASQLYIAFTKSTTDAFIKPIRHVLMGAALPGFFLAALLILATYLLLKKFTDPIGTLKEGAAIIGGGNLDHRIDVHTADEIEDLANEFNKMTATLRASHQDLEKKIRERTAELERSNQALEKASNLKSQFLASMSHELRTPLNAIMGFSDVLTEEVYGEINEKQRRYLNNIHESGKHLLEVINNILDLSKIEAGRMTLHLRELVVDDAIAEIQNLGLQLASKAGLKLCFHTRQAPTLIVADCVRFRQIMYNLLSNAIKFTPEGGEIDVTIRQVGDALEVSVADTGIGISEEYIDAIFDPFRQVDGSSSRNYEGTGLGLALTREFVEMHGGHIQVSSRQNRGSCFTFQIPLNGPHNAATGNPQENPQDE